MKNEVDDLMLYFIGLFVSAVIAVLVYINLKL
jgi:hypothetical protein